MYCTKCGGVVADGVAFCTTCGQAVAGAVGVVARPQVGSVVAAYPAPPGTQYSGFWIRFAAYLIDGLIMSVAIIVLFIPLTAAFGLSSAMSGMRWDRGMEPAQITLLVGWIFLLLGLAVMVTWLYHALLESSEWQATIGKKAVGLIVTDMAGQPISFARASGRHFAKFISNLIPFEIGYIMAAFTDKRQALHDMIAGCLILKNN